MIKNVVFYIGMVLVDFRWRGFLRDRGADDEAVEYIGNNSVMAPIWGQLDLGVKSEAEVVSEMRAGMDRYLELFDTMFDDMTELVRPLPGNREWLMSLREKGLKIYLLSNYPYRMFNVHSEKSFDFMDLIDGKVVSSFVKMIKPNEDIYRCLLDKYGLIPQECVFLDDRKENTAAAEELGFHTVTVENREQAMEELEKILTLV